MFSLLVFSAVFAVFFLDVIAFCECIKCVTCTDTFAIVLCAFVIEPTVVVRKAWRDNASGQEKRVGVPPKREI